MKRALAAMLLGLTLAGDAPAAAPAATVLAYRPAGPAVLRIKEEHKGSIASADGHQEDHALRLVREVEVSVEGRDGLLVASSRPGREKIEVDGERAATRLKPDSEPSLQCFTPTGEACAGRETPIGVLRLPERPVRVGDTWTQRIPAGTSSPLEVVVEHRLAALEDCGTGRCARILSSGTAEREAPDGAVEIHLSATAIFSVEQGVVLKSRWESSVKAVHAFPGTEIPPVRTDRKTLRVGVRLPPPELARAQTRP